jgi:hypothetical protein
MQIIEHVLGPRSSQRAALLFVAVASLLLALAYTAPYGTQNQTTYLLDPMHRAMPELFHKDWFLSQPSYMPVFGWLAQWLYRIDPDGTRAIVAAHVIVALVIYVALYRLVSAVSPAWQTYLLVATFVTVTTNLAMGGSYLTCGYLQPSELATLGWIAALAALVRGRYLACGLCLAAGGLVHVNFLVLGFGLFALTALIVGARGRELAKLLAPQLVVLACYAPVLFGSAGLNAEALRVLVEFHAYGHYGPERLVRWMPELLAWLTAASVAIRLERPSRELRVLWWFSVVGTAVVCTTALVIYAGFTSLTQLYWARIAPFAMLGFQIILASALIRHAGTSTRTRRLAFAGAIVLVLAITGGYELRMFGIVPTIAGSLAAVIVLVVPERFARLACTILAVGGFAAAIAWSNHGSGFTVEESANKNELALMRWAREQTPVDALFLTPPDLGRFRLLARRAVVADTKSPPLQPDLMVAWYHRLCAMVKLPEAATTREVSDRYKQLTAADLEEVGRAFGVDYIVASPSVHLGTPVYANTQYAVFAVTAPE